MRIIDNLNELLGDDLEAEIKPGSKARIAASTFSICAYEALRAGLEKGELTAAIDALAAATRAIDDARGACTPR
ncbi:hypothetical protein OAM92_00350 [Acidimicrobiales bacterium]|nr:hypothetical protein [Acidimicrobiales bacterium]